MRSVYKYYLLIALTGLRQAGVSQDLYNGISLQVKGSISLFVGKNFANAATATYQNDASVTFKSNIANNQGSMAPGTGTSFITGTSVQSLTGTQPFVVFDATINNTSAGSSNFTFSNDLEVAGTTTFTDGIVVTNANKMKFRTNATYTGAANGTHVNGYVEKAGNQPFVFPVGDGTLLRTAAITTPTLNTDAYLCKYFYTTPNPTFNTSLKDAILDTVSYCEYWMLTRTTGIADVKVTLSWQAPNSSCLYLNPTYIRVAGWDGTKWKDRGNGGATGNSISGTVISTSAINTYNAFTLAKANIALPVTLRSFEAKQRPEGVRVEWIASGEAGIKSYGITRSCDGVIWETVGQVPANGNDKNTRIYKLIDTNPCKGMNYYQLIEVNNSGHATPQLITGVEYVNRNVALLVYPTHNTGLFTVSITGGYPQYQMTISDIFGKQIKTYMLEDGDNVLSADLIPGPYFVRVKTDKEQITSRLIVVQ